MAFSTWRLKITKHVLWLGIAWWTGGAWVLYLLMPPPRERPCHLSGSHDRLDMDRHSHHHDLYPGGHMREQVCLYMCPWPRIQAALTDEQALNVAYRYDRGEPRVSLKEAHRLAAAGKPAGDCIDCHQCVASARQASISAKAHSLAAFNVACALMPAMP